MSIRLRFSTLSWWSRHYFATCFQFLLFLVSLNYILRSYEMAKVLVGETGQVKVTDEYLIGLNQIISINFTVYIILFILLWLSMVDKIRNIEWSYELFTKWNSCLLYLAKRFKTLFSWEASFLVKLPFFKIDLLFWFGQVHKHRK